MFCTTYRKKLSDAIDSRTDVPLSVKAHLEHCSSCKEFHEKLLKINSALTGCPNAGLVNYNIEKLNSSIFDKIDDNESKQFLTVKYPTQPFNHKYAVAATALIAITLSLTIFTNILSDKSSLIPSNTEIAANPTEHTTTETAAATTNQDNHNISDTLASYTPVFSPQAAVIYHLATLPYSNIAKLPYKEKFQESQEVYEKTQEITEKSSKVINTVFQNGFMFLKPF